jgi:hypothetical protein
MRSKTLLALSILAISVAATTSVQATTLGDLGFVAFSPSTSNTASITTATAITLATWTSTFGSGIFAGMGFQNFGNVSFNTSIPNSLTFGNAVFGTFTSTSITAFRSNPNFLSLAIMGLWTPGTQGGVTGGPFKSLLDISFSQVGGPGTIFSASASFATTNTVIPEPSGIMLGLTGLIPGVATWLRRRRRGTVAMA